MPSRRTRNHRTLHDVLTYIQVKQKDRILEESMNQIARGTGYSNATIHRALLSLEDQGWIRVQSGINQNRPSIIHYVGELPDLIENPDEKTELIRQAQVALDQLDQATRNVYGVISQLREFVAQQDAIQEMNGFTES